MSDREAQPPRRRGRILVSLLLLLLLVGVLPLLGTSYNLFTASRDVMELDQKTLQLDKARGLGQQVAVYMSSLEGQVTAISRTLEVDATAGGFPAMIQRIRVSKALERYLGGTSHFSFVSIVGKDGSGPRSGLQLPEQAVDALLQEGWQRGLAGDRMTSRPIISTSLQEPVIVISEPLTVPSVIEGNPPDVQGVLLVVASLNPLWSMTHEMAREGMFDVYVVDERGHLIAHSDPKKLQGPTLDVSDVEIVKGFMESGGRAGATVPFNIKGPKGSVEMLGTYTGVPDDSHWGVIVQIEKDKAYFQALQMRRNALILVALVTLAAAVLGTVFAGQISRPIQALAGGARRLAKGDYSTRVDARTNNEVGLLSETFNFMAEEIQKSIEEIRKQAETNKELFMGSIRMLANAIDEKDPYTRGHSERVAFYSKVMAFHLGMGEEEVERVHLAGIIHDVGKIGIEDKILRKPAALTDEEYEIMKQHPTKGAHILEAVPLLRDMAGPGLQHHENWDGTGYPLGLKAEEIPLLGRIVSVADAFDAMTTDRPYSKAMTFEDALKRLRFLAGKKFDATCVEAIEKASAAGDLTPAKARRASVAARQAPPAAPPAPPPS